MAFNRKKFLEALIGVADPTTPTTPVSMDFAQYFAANPWGGMNLQTDAAAIAEKQKQEGEREEGALSKTFGWLMSLGNAVENSILDVAEGDIQDIPRDIGAGLLHAAQPSMELYSIPGVKLPFGDLGTDKVSEIVDKYNTQHEGTGNISGKRLLEEFGANPENNVRNAISGFAVDVLTDPLTYVGVGIPGRIGQAKKLPEVIKASENAGEVLTRAAASPEEVAKASLPSGPIIQEGKVVPQPPNPNWIKSILGGGKVGPVAESVLPKALSRPSIEELPLDPVRGIIGQGPKLPEISVGQTATPSLFTGRTESPLQAIINRTNVEGLNPTAKKAASISKANETRLYEKLRPVDVEGLPVPRANKRYAREYSLGESLTSNIRGWIDEPRPITRADQEALINDFFEEGVLAGEKAIGSISENVTDLKHFAKGFEDDLISRGYTFPEGRYSQWLNKSDVKTPEDARKFFTGKPMKERPLIIEDTGAVTTRFGDKFIESKGITPEAVANAVKQVGQLADEGIIPTRVIPPVEGDLKPLVVDLAEKAREGWKQADKLENLNPANQANLYNTMYSNLMKRYGKDIKVNRMQARNTALKMTRAAEDYLIKTHGLKPMYWDGTGLRLTSVIAELDPKLVTSQHMTKILDAWRTQDLTKITDPVAREAFVNAMARRHIEVGAIAKGVLEGFQKTDKIMQEGKTFQKYQVWKRDAIKAVKEQMKKSGATTKEATAAAKIAENAGIEAGVMTESMKLLDNVTDAERIAMAKGKPVLVNKMNDTIVKAIGKGKDLAKADPESLTTIDSVMMRFFTSYGMGDMHKTSLSRAQAVEFMAKQRAHLFGGWYKNFTKEEREAAWFESANLFKDKASFKNDKIKGLSQQMKDYMDNILGEGSEFSKLTPSAYADLGGSVAERSMVTMIDLNRHMKAVGSHWQFSGKGAPGTANHWTQSWKKMDPRVEKQDPASFLYDLDLAMFRLITEYSVIDDFAMRFGKRGDDVVNGLHTTGLNHHRVPNDVRFEGKTAREFEALMERMQQGAWHPDSDFGKMYVKGLRIWKTGMTIYSPSHHIRNLIGDSWLMWLAGHNDPTMFAHSKKILGSQRARYKEAFEQNNFEMLNQLLGKSGEASWARAQGSDVILKKRGTNITADEIYGEAVQRGVLLDASHAEDIFQGETALFSSLSGKRGGNLINKPLGGYGHKTAKTVSEYREHFVRTAHFTSAVNKRLTPELASRLRKVGNDQVARSRIMKKVYDDAADEVRKWHPDGRDMTQFEQKVMRNVIPFYSWQRKVIPLLAESMLTRPSKITMYPRGMYAVQGALGIESPGPSDPFPEDQLFPDWMRQSGIGPIGDSESDNPIARFFGNLGRNVVNPMGGEIGYTNINPGNPFNDTISQFGQMGNDPVASVTKGLGSQLTPAFNIPKELLSDKKFTGAPISKDQGGEGRWPWAAEQVPIMTILQRIIEAGEEHQKGTEEGINREALYNYLTGMGIKGSGQYIKSAEFDKKRAIKKILEGR